MTLDEQLRLHRRAEMVIVTLQHIESALATDRGDDFFKFAKPAKQHDLTVMLKVAENRAYECETRLALAPLKPGGAR